MAHIERRLKGYSVRWRGLDGRCHSRQCPDKATAQRVERAIECALAEGRDWTPTPARADSHADLEVMFADVIRDRARSLREGSVRNLTLVTGQFLTMLGDHPPPTALSRQALGSFFAWLVAPHPTDRELDPRPSTCSPSTAAGRVRMIEGLWRDLAEHEVHGPLVPRPARLRDLPRVEATLQPAPTWAEMDAAVASADGWYRDLLLLARFTGLRRSQLMAIRWDWVDLGRASMWVHPSVGKTRQERRGRFIPLSSHLVAELARWKRRSAFVIHTGTARRSLRQTCVDAAWRRAGVRPTIWAGDEQRRGQSMHAFRHGFITGLLAAGAAEYLVQRLVGHAPASVTIERYADLDQVLLPQLQAVVAMIPPLPPLRLAKEA